MYLLLDLLLVGQRILLVPYSWDCAISSMDDMEQFLPFFLVDDQILWQNV